jgi:hypothetical protein
MTSRKKPGVAFWVAVAVVVVLVGYPLSMGPVLWISVHGWIPTWMHGPIGWFYWPLDMVMQNATRPISDPLV